MSKRFISPQWLMAIFLFAVCGSVFADDAAQSVKVLDAVGNFYKPLQTAWYDVIKGYATKLFWLLVLVDVSWSGVIYALEKNDITEIVVSMTKKIFPIGFFWSLLKLSDTWIPAIINSFVQIGQQAGNASAVTPDGIIYEGASVAIGILLSLSKLGILESLAAVIPFAIIAILIFLCYCFVAVQLLVTLIESYIVFGAGVILLGFGGSRWTTDMATKYLQNAVGTGLKLMMLYLILGAGKAIFGDASSMIDTDHMLGSLFAALATAVIYGYLAFSVPAIASGMMSGSPALTAGGALGAAVTMGAAMAGAAAATAGGLGAAAGGLTGAAAGAGGLAKALGAGYNSALDGGKSGLGAVAGAVGEVAKHGLGLAAGGVGDALKGGASSFAESVSNSTGGQIANSIEASRGGSMSGAEPSSPATQGDAPATASGSSPSSSASSPVPTSGAAASGSPSASPAASAPSATTTSGAPTGGGSAPASSANTSSAGDASNASIGPGSTVSPPADGSNQGPPKAALHERIRDLQGYVPQDMAPAASMNIQSGHTAD